MKKLNVAIIGAGFGVTSHLPAFKRNKHCKVNKNNKSQTSISVLE